MYLYSPDFYWHSGYKNSLHSGQLTSSQSILGSLQPRALQNSFQQAHVRPIDHMIVLATELTSILSTNFSVCVAFHIAVTKSLTEMGLEGKMYGHGSIYVTLLSMNGETENLEVKSSLNFYVCLCGLMSVTKLDFGKFQN